MGLRTHVLAFAVATVAGLLGVARPCLAAQIRVSKGPWVQRLTKTEAVIRFEVDPPAPASVTLKVGGAGDGGALRTAVSRDPRALHTVVLSGLEPATSYEYAVAAVGAAHDPPPAAFTTAPPDGDTPFRFQIYGDNRTDDAAHAAVVKAMLREPADFLVHTGDFVESGASPVHWQTFFDIEAPLIRERCLFACVGNHELTDGSGIQFARFFGSSDVAPDPAAGSARSPTTALTHLNGTFRWGNTRFFLLNGMVPWRSGIDRSWLDDALAAADAEPGLAWRVVVVHHGPWSSGPHGNNARLHDAGVPATLRAHKVDLVLAGHDHIYERGIEEGLAYMVTGGGGAPTYRVKNRLPSARHVESVRHFVVAAVTSSMMAFKVVRADGSLVEQCGLRKGAGWDCDGPTPEASPVESSPPPPRATPPASPPPVGPGGATSSRCGCRVAGAPEDPSFAIGALSSAFAAFALFAFRRRRAILAR